MATNENIEENTEESSLDPRGRRSLAIVIFGLLSANIRSESSTQ